MNIHKCEAHLQVSPDFVYSSDNNEDWMDIMKLRDWIDTNVKKIGEF